MQTCAGLTSPNDCCGCDRASQSANLLSYRKVAQQLELDDKTVKEHTLLLEQLFLIRRLPGWRPRARRS